MTLDEALSRLIYATATPRGPYRDTEIAQVLDAFAATVRREALEDVRVLLEQWRAMAKAALAEGPIPGDEDGHYARWTSVELSAAELGRALAGG